VVVMFSMGMLGGGEPAAPVTAPPAKASGTGVSGTGNAGVPGARPSGPGMRPGAPVPSEPGEDSGSTGGASLPKGSGM
jgi:hypothetical protein